MRRNLLFFLGLSLSSGLHADVLTLSSVVKRGLEFSPEIQKAEAEWKSNQAITDQRERALFPTLDLNATATMKDDPARLDNQNSLRQTDSSESYDASLQLVQPLFRGGLILDGIASTKLAEEISRQEWYNVRQKAVEALVSGYYTLAENERRLRVAEEHSEVLKSYADIVSRYEKIGRARRMDRLQAVVNLSLVESEKVKLKRDRIAASDELKRLLGLSEGGAPLEGQLQVSVAPSAPIDLEAAVEAALKNNPEYRSAVLKEQKQGYDNSLDFASDRPALDLRASVGYLSPDRPDWFKEDSRYYSVGLSLKVPIFSGLSSLAKRRSHIELLKAESKQVEITRLNIRQEIQAAREDLSSEYIRLNAAETAAGQGREALQLANAAYRQGTASSQDVLNAQRTRYDSEKVLIESQFSYLTALLNLRRLMGVDLEKVYAQ